MQYSEQLYQRYLEELQALEEFKAANSEYYSNVFQDLGDDPCTRHLIEVLSFFTARNALQGEKKIVEIYQRLFKQYLPFLCHPLPSMGMIQFIPSKDSSEKIDCREGTEICLNISDGKKAYFQTLSSISILPIQLNKFQFSYSRETGTKLFLSFQSSSELNSDVGELKFYIDYLNHFPSSLSLAYTLREHLKRVSVNYNTTNFQTNGITSPFSFDLPHENTITDHPVEKIRLLLHFPEQELFFSVNVAPHVGKWTSFTLCFDLGEDWPESLQLSKDTFVPFVVPIINIRKKAAEPIRCNGTTDSYPILYSQPEENFILHSVQGIYMIENHKKIPIKPAMSTHDKGSYELVAMTHSKESSNHLILDFPDAFQHPKLITVEALWYQPWLSHELEKEIRGAIVNQALTGLEIRLLGKICPSENRSKDYDISFLTQLLALKNQSKLNLKETLFLMNALKNCAETYFKDVPSFIKDFKVTDSPGFRSSFLVSEYSFYLEKLDDKNRGLALLFFKHMRDFLDLWLSNIDIELTLNSTQFKKTYSENKRR